MNQITNTIYNTVYNHWSTDFFWDSDALFNPPISDYYEEPKKQKIAETIQRIVAEKGLNAKSIWDDANQSSQDSSQLARKIGLKLGIKQAENCRTWCKAKRS